MEILERGELPEEREFTARCTYCKSLVKFKQGEGVVSSDWRNGSYIRVQCPLCKRDITTDL